MGLQPSATEIEYLQSAEEEKFKLLMPIVLYYRWINQDNMDKDWGHENELQWADPVEVHAQYDWHRKIREYENGTWIQTNKLIMRVSKRECDNLSIVPELGDSFVVMGNRTRVLSTQTAELIKGTQYDYLHYEITIDTKEAIES